MSIYGYCRISTAKQSIDRQIRNIKAEYPAAHIVQEAYTGTLDDMECMKLTGVARNTYYKYKRQIRAELADEEKLL